MTKIVLKYRFCVILAYFKIHTLREVAQSLVVIDIAELLNRLTIQTIDIQIIVYSQQSPTNRFYRVFNYITSTSRTLSIKNIAFFRRFIKKSILSLLHPLVHTAGTEKGTTLLTFLRGTDYQGADGTTENLARLLLETLYVETHDIVAGHFC